MKTAAKVFIIIGMIVQFFLIYPLVLGIFALKAMDNAKNKNDIVSWGVVSLLFVNLLGGIFMLCIRDEELMQNKSATIANENIVSNKPQNENKNISVPPVENKNINTDFILSELCDEL